MWLRQLEEDAGVAPVWEVLFQAMCCPVPQASAALVPLCVCPLRQLSPEAPASSYDRDAYLRVKTLNTQIHVIGQNSNTTCLAGAEGGPG